MIKIKKGDEVVITAGKDKTKRGKVERVLSKEQAVVVGGLNLYKRHQRQKDKNKPGGIVDFPRPLSLGKVALVCPKCNKVTRVGFVLKDKKLRVCRKCHEVIA